MFALNDELEIIKIWEGSCSGICEDRRFTKRFLPSKGKVKEFSYARGGSGINRSTFEENFFDGNRQVSHIDISHSDLPKGDLAMFTELAYLESLHLKDNNLKSVSPTSALNGPNLKSLCLGGNKFGSSCDVAKDFLTLARLGIPCDKGHRLIDTAITHFGGRTYDFRATTDLLVYLANNPECLSTTTSHVSMSEVKHECVCGRSFVNGSNFQNLICVCNALKQALNLTDGCGSDGDVGKLNLGPVDCRYGTHESMAVTIIVPTLVVIILVFGLSIGTVIYCKKKATIQRSWLNKDLTVDDDRGENFKCDLFIAYSSRDPDACFVNEMLIPHLEDPGSTRPLKCATYFDLFKPRDLIVNNVKDAVNSSRRILVVMSRMFALSEGGWLQKEFEIAMEVDHRRVNLLVLGERPSEEEMGEDLSRFVREVTYLSYEPGEDPASRTNQKFWDNVARDLAPKVTQREAEEDERRQSTSLTTAEAAVELDTLPNNNGQVVVVIDKQNSVDSGIDDETHQCDESERIIERECCL